MKKLLLLLCIIASSRSPAQKIHFSDTTNVWKSLFVNNTYLPFPPTFTYYSYAYSGDSIIDTVQYRVFSFGMIREDTTLKKVYLRDPDNDTDVVLMDYNLNVGDTFSVTYDSPSPYLYIVDSVDSTLINMTWHKVWHFSRWVFTSFQRWCDVIEGVGCIQHPLYMVWGVHIPGEAYWSMYCFSNQGITPPVAPAVSFFDNTTSCSTFPTIKASQIEKQKISIYPNPAQNELHIEFPEGIRNVTIKNLLGVIVFQSDYNADCATIDISRLPVGSYFVLVNSTQVYNMLKKED